MGPGPETVESGPNDGCRDMDRRVDDGTGGRMSGKRWVIHRKML